MMAPIAGSLNYFTELTTNILVVSCPPSTVAFHWSRKYATTVALSPAGKGSLTWFDTNLRKLLYLAVPALIVDCSLPQTIQDSKSVECVYFGSKIRKSWRRNWGMLRSSATDRATFLFTLLFVKENGSLRNFASPQVFMNCFRSLTKKWDRNFSSPSSS